MSKESKTVGDGAACVSLACCTFPWFAAGFRILPKLTGFYFFQIMGFAVLFAIASAFLQSRLWKFALPFAVLMFFFVWYVMTT